MLWIPSKAEPQHVQIIADTGAGKTTIIMQILRQIRSRGDSAIVYDPALESTRRFDDAKRGDVILNPLDKRCPYWGPAEELRRSSEADALAVSLFQPPQDKKGEFFIEIPQQFFPICRATDPPHRSSFNGCVIQRKSTIEWQEQRSRTISIGPPARKESASLHR